MKWHKSPDALVQAFDHCLPVVAGVERKAMFGYPCAFMNGHLFCGLHQDRIIVHLPEPRRDALVAEGASVFDPMPGQAMKEYVLVPAEIVQDRERLRALLGEALAHASSLAPKVSPTARKKAPAPRRTSPALRKPARAKKAPAKVPAKKAPSKRVAVKKRAGPVKKAPARKAGPAKKALSKKAAAHKARPSKKRRRG